MYMLAYTYNLKLNATPSVLLLSDSKVNSYNFETQNY